MEKAEDTKTRRQAAEKAKAQASTVAERFAQAITGKLSGPEQSSGASSHDLPAPERIGHVLVAANETAPISRHAGKSVLEAVKRFDKSHEAPSPSASDQHIGTMSRAELLVLSEQIIVDGSSLRQIYETHLIGERGLRRLVAEHMQGQDLKKALRQEVVEREIDFERDPDVRDIVPQAALKAGAGGGQGKEALNALLERASIKINDSGEEAAFFKARALYEANQLQQHKQQRRLIDFSLAAAISILILLIIALYLGRA
jgi:hypothetical protein